MNDQSLSQWFKHYDNKVINHEDMLSVLWDEPYRLYQCHEDVQLRWKYSNNSIIVQFQIPVTALDMPILANKDYFVDKLVNRFKEIELWCYMTNDDGTLDAYTVCVTNYDTNHKEYTQLMKERNNYGL